MAKKQIKKYVFHPGVSVTDNLNPNAYALITQNRQFILDTLVAYINYNVTNNIAPYVGYTFDPTKCIRDDGFIMRMHTIYVMVEIFPLEMFQVIFGSTVVLKLRGLNNLNLQDKILLKILLTIIFLQTKQHLHTDKQVLHK